MKQAHPNQPFPLAPGKGMTDIDTDPTVVFGLLIPYAVVEIIAGTIAAGVQRLPNPDKLPPEVWPVVVAFQKIARQGVSGQGSIELPADSNDTWDTPSTIAKRLNMTRQNVTKRCRSGSITASKDFTGTWRISPAEVQRLVAASSAAS